MADVDVENNYGWLLLHVAPMGFHHGKWFGTFMLAIRWLESSFGKRFSCTMLDFWTGQDADSFFA